MTGRQKIEAALSLEGTREIPAVITYQGIFYRDHLREISSHPWWHEYDPDLQVQMDFAGELIESAGLDWFDTRSFYSSKERPHIFIDVRPEGVYRINRLAGTEEKLDEPVPGGDNIAFDEFLNSDGGYLPESFDEIGKVISDECMRGKDAAKIKKGQNDLSLELIRKYDGLYPIGSVGEPFGILTMLLGFEKTMMLIAEKPHFVKQACGKLLDMFVQRIRKQAFLGAKGVFLDIAYADLISPEAFRKLVLPYDAQLVEEARAAGLHSIYCFLGNPAGKLKDIIGINADALMFEESKKNFIIDMEEMAEIVNGKTALMGNLDSIGILQDGSEEQLREGIKRQLRAAKRNSGRFVMCTGSPVTPSTPAEKVRRYCEMVHELGNI